MVTVTTCLLHKTALSIYRTHWFVPPARAAYSELWITLITRSYHYLQYNAKHFNDKITSISTVYDRSPGYYLLIALSLTPCELTQTWSQYCI